MEQQNSSLRPADRFASGNVSLADRHSKEGVEHMSTDPTNTNPPTGTTYRIDATDNLHRSDATAKKKRRHPMRTTLIVIAVLVVAAVMFQLTLPSLVKNQINERFADMGDYSGYVDDVDIAL